MIAVEEEGGEAARVNVLSNGEEVATIEFKGMAALLHNLLQAVQELQEYGGNLIFRSPIIAFLAVPFTNPRVLIRNYCDGVILILLTYHIASEKGVQRSTTPFRSAPGSLRKCDRKDPT